MLRAGEAGAPVARIFTSRDMPPGLWTRNEHWFAPLTPLCADFQVGSEAPRGFNAAMDDLALPTPRFDFVVIDGYGYQAMREPTSPPSSDLLSAFEERVREHHELFLIEQWHEHRRAEVETELERIRQLDLQVFSDDQLLFHIRDLSEYTVELCRIHFANILATGMILGRFGIFCNDRLQLADADVFRMFAGASNASRRAAVELERVARVVKQSPTLQAALDGPKPWADAGIQDVLQPYLQAYGHQALDFEFATPTLVERPERAVRMLQDTLARLEHRRARSTDPDQHVLRQGWRNQLADEMDRLEFDRLLQEALDAYGVRDDDCTFVMLAWGLMRRALLEAGGRLVSRGVLRTREDVWYLRRAEVEEALSEAILDLTELGARIHDRRAERERQQKAGLPPSTAGVPMVATAALALAGLSPEARQALAALAWTRRHGGAPAGAGLVLEQQSVQGVGASAGLFTGIARVIHGESEFERVRSGEVLVCPFTSPTWTVLFGTVGAIVANEGGLLSHPAITAREFGIPAVVGTRVATDVIADGSIVTVDGSAGLVLIGENPPAVRIETRTVEHSQAHRSREREGLALPADAPTISWLEETNCQNPALTGGKAANLSRLAERYRVPTGFCITSAAFDLSAAEHGLLTADLRQQIHAAYAHLAERSGLENVAVAVRSSATDEDGQNAAFAGQYETVLNVKGAKAIEDAILQCWRSANSARARAYRQARGGAIDGVRVAVLVQQMIPAEAAGVTFSVNPVTGQKREAVVNAAFGLGESVVRGTVTPDTFVVKLDGPTGPVIVNRQISRKNLMTVLTDEGTAEVGVPKDQRDHPSVRDDQVYEAATLAWQLEAETGWPVDVECAWHAGLLYVLQCRPITALPVNHALETVR